MDSGISGRESHRAWLRMGWEPFERVGACQTLARQAAPTALAPIYHLTAWSPSRLERFELLQPLDVVERDLALGPAEGAGRT